MKRISTGSQVAATPTFPADIGTPGFFADAATTPSAAPTQLSPKWVTSVQEAICLTILESGAALSDSMSQFSEVVRGVQAVTAHATDTGVVSPPLSRAVVAVVASRAAGVASGCFAGGYGLASGQGSAVIGGETMNATGQNSACVGGGSHTASALDAVCVGGTSGAASAADAGTFAGDNPTASGLKAVAIGGHDLTASGANAAAIGGDTNVASVSNSAAVGGSNNAAGGAESFIGGGNSHDIQAGGVRSGILGGNNHTISGAGSVAIGGDGHSITGANGFCVAGDSNTVAAAKSGAIACTSSILWSGSTKTHMVAVASTGVTLSTDGDPSGGGADGYCLAGGHTNDPVTGASNVDVTWLLSSKHGTLALDNTTLIAGADYAEYFPNVTEEVIRPGSLVTRQGKRVRLARPGDRVLGVVSAAPSVVGNAAGLSWSGSKLRDEWGALVYQNREICRFETTDAEGVVYQYRGLVSKCPVEIPADAERWMSRDPVRNPDFDSSQPYSPRQARPEAWTCVALLGQVRVRIGPQVEEGDYLTPGAEGCALGTLARPDGRTVEVMEITSPFDEARGYGVALCLVG